MIKTNSPSQAKSCLPLALKAEHRRWLGHKAEGKFQVSDKSYQGIRTLPLQLDTIPVRSPQSMLLKSVSDYLSEFRLGFLLVRLSHLA